MILYHVITNYHLLNAVVHSKTHSEQSVIICSTWIKEKIKKIQKLNDFFHKVHILDANYRFSHNTQETTDYFHENLGDLDAFSKIYVWGAQFSFGVSLIEQHKRFIFCEEGCGILTREYILKDIERKQPLKSKYFDLVENYGLYNGDNPVITSILCNKKAQKELINNENIIDFDVVKELEEMPADVRKNILNFFEIGHVITINNNSSQKNVLLLTQHFCNLSILSFEEHVLIYQTLIDYFFHNQYLVIKTHPDDLIYYGQIFTNSQIIRGVFPSEFIPFVLKGDIATVATIGSTSIFGLYGHFENVFELDSRYEKDFPMTHRYYATLCIAKEIKRSIYCKGSNELLLRRLADTLDMDSLLITDEKEQLNQPYMLVVDDISSKGELGREDIICGLDTLDNDSVAIFINSKSDYCWYNYFRREIWDNLIPIVLHKEVNNTVTEDFYASTDDEVIYVYSKNKEILGMLRDIEIEKVLPYTGITVKKLSLSPDQERIKMLEGILEATERRLLYYIEKEKNQKD